MSVHNSPQFSGDIIEDLSIDCIIFGFQGSKLQVMLVQHADGLIKDQWALPGGFVTYNENIDAAAHRLLRDLAGVKDIYLEQLKAFGDADRYPTKRVITIAYYALTRRENYELTPGFTASDVRWFNIEDIRELPYDHGKILLFAWNNLKRKVKYEPIGFNLLPQKFTLFQLQELYEAILEVKLDKPNFRRKIKKMNLLIDCNEMQKGVSHRAANLYRFDKLVYDRLKNEGFIFGF